MKRNSVTSEDSPLTGEQMQKYFRLISEFYSEDGREKRDVLRELFGIYDRNGDGSISAREMKVVMSFLYPEGMSEFDIETIMSRVDLNHDRHIDFEEFAEMMMKFKQ
jgi:Ca2+-binding EF-hand superfamily protein